MNRHRGVTLAGLCVAIALFVLYTNWPVVASQQGIVPSSFAIVVPVLLGIAVVHQLVIARRPLVIDRTLLTMLAFLVVLLLSTFTAEGYEEALGRITAFLTEGVIIYFLVRNAVRSVPELRTAIIALLCAAGLLAALTTVQAITGDYEQTFTGLAQRNLERVGQVSLADNEELWMEDRARGPVDEPNRFAQILLLVAPLGVVTALNSRRRVGSTAAWLCVGILLVGVLLTYSRGALVSLIVLLILAVPLNLIRPARLVGALTIGALVAVLAIPGFTDRVGSMAGVAALFGHTQVEADGPTKGRTTEMLAALAAYADHPILGVGPGQYVPFHSVHYQALPEVGIREIPIPRRAHNLYLEIAAESGTIGLIIFMLIPTMLLLDLGVLRRALRHQRPDMARLAAGFSLAILAYLGTGMFLHLAFERYYWALIALTAAAAGVFEELVWEEEADQYETINRSYSTFGGVTC